MAESPCIIDVTRENYDEVMRSSFKVPVLIDFWASWCQPCQVLMPVLARLADAYQGRFLLGKLNTEEEPEIAGRFGIRSIPTVKLFRDGRPVDEFMGALPEHAVREFLERHLPRESDAAVDAARQHLRAGNAAAALAGLQAAREADPDNPRIFLALAQAHVALGDTGAAEAALDALPATEQAKPAAVAIRSRLYFAGRIADAPAAPVLASRLETDAADHEARYQLAMRKVLDDDYETAMELLLELMRQDRKFGDDAARHALLKVFELLGDDPRVREYRHRMARLMY